MLTSLVRADRIGPTGSESTRLEHRGEAGDALDDLLEHDVGLVEPDLRTGVGGELSIFTTSAGRAAVAGSVTAGR